MELITAVVSKINFFTVVNFCRHFECTKYTFLLFDILTDYVLPVHVVRLCWRWSPDQHEHKPRMLPISNYFCAMEKAKKRSAKEASKIFHDIMKASVK
jgi:hypothetical protein